MYDNCGRNVHSTFHVKYYRFRGLLDVKIVEKINIQHNDVFFCLTDPKK